MYKVILAVLFLLTLLPGCAIRGGGVTLDMPGVEVGIEGGSAHCPPGQAKKGNC